MLNESFEGGLKNVLKVVIPTVTHNTPPFVIYYGFARFNFLSIIFGLETRKS